jgi:hypothetical protein
VGEQLTSRYRVRARLRAAELPATSDVDVLLDAVADHLGQRVTVVTDPFLRRARHAHARNHPRAAAVELRIPPGAPRAQAACRALGEAPYPRDRAAARSAAALLSRHLSEHQEWQRRTALAPLDAYQERAVGEQVCCRRSLGTDESAAHGQESPAA